MGNPRLHSLFHGPHVKPTLTLTARQMMPQTVQLPPPPSNPFEEKAIVNQQAEVPDLLKCPIGLNFMVKAVKPESCKHTFDEENILKWLKQERDNHQELIRINHGEAPPLQHSCPICKTAITKLVDNSDIQQIIEYCRYLVEQSHQGNHEKNINSNFNRM